MQKSQWPAALFQLLKKPKINQYIISLQWRHLLTTGNKASFYDYMAFIKNNKNYPRMGRIKYLAEHKVINR